MKKTKIFEVNGLPVKDWDKVMKSIEKTGVYMSPAARKFLATLKTK